MARRSIFSKSNACSGNEAADTAQQRPDLQAIIAKHSPALSDGGAAAREAADLASKNKVLADKRITAISFSDAQVAELNRVVTPAIEDWKASMAKRGFDGEKLYTRARELIAQYQADTR